MDKRKQTAARGRVGTSSKRKQGKAVKVGGAGQTEKSAGRTRKAAAKGGAERRGLAWSEWLLIGILAAATLAIGLALATQLLDTPEEQAKKELAKIADDYYVEYVYPQLTEAGQKTEKLGSFCSITTASIRRRRGFSRRRAAIRMRPGCGITRWSHMGRTITPPASFGSVI